MPSGGSRRGSGRPKTFGNQKTKAVRLPIEHADNVVRLFKQTYDAQEHALDNVMSISPAMASASLMLPLYEFRVPCGGPAPAESYVENRIDLMKFLVEHADTTFYAVLSGDSMEGVGIFDGDIAVVQRSTNVKNGDVVLVTVNNDITCKRFRQEAGRILLVPENDKYKPIVLSKDDNIEIWGVVLHTIRSHRGIALTPYSN